MNNQTSSGIGFGGILTIVFVIAKLWGIINWSWWLVFLPILIPLAILLLIIIIGLIAMAAMGIGAIIIASINKGD